MRNDSFYSEIDRRRFSVTRAWVVLIVVLIVVFTIIIGLLFSLRHYYQKLNFSFWSSKTIDFKENTNQLFPPLGSNLPQFSVIFSSITLSSYLNSNESTLPLGNIVTKIGKYDLKLYGRTKESRIKLPIVLTIKPKFENQQFSFIAEPSEIEEMMLSQTATNQIIDTLNRRLNFDLTLNGKYKIDSYLLENDKLTINLINNESPPN